MAENKKIKKIVVFVLLVFSGVWTILMVYELGSQGLSLSEFSFYNYGKVVPPAVVTILSFMKYSKYLKEEKG